MKKNEIVGYTLARHSGYQGLIPVANRAGSFPATKVDGLAVFIPDVALALARP